MLISQILNLFLFDIYAQYFATGKEIHNIQMFNYRQRSATTERRSTTRDQMIAVKEILTQISIACIQLIVGNTLLYPGSASNLPVPERDIFCILILDIISIRALVGFSLFFAKNYYYMKGPACYNVLQ